MLDLFEAHRDRIAEAWEAVAYPAEATGLAVALANNVVSFDLFDKPGTCEQVWPRLVASCVLQALDREPPARLASVADVEDLLQASRQIAWELFPAVGAGQKYRAKGENELAGSALVFQGTIVHLTVTAPL